MLFEIKYQELIPNQLFQLCSGEGMGARVYRGDENQEKQKQANSFYRTIWKAEQTHQPFQKFVHLVHSEPVKK